MAKEIKTKLVLDTRDAEKSVDRVSGALKALVGAATVRELVSLGDQFTTITNRLNSVSNSSQEAQRAFNLVRQVASDTRSDLGSVADLFTDITIATEELGLSQQEVAGVASTFSKALKISGADAGTAAGAIRQFGQALAKGTLNGDEFTSIMEANPVFMRRMAAALGVATGALKEMASEGELTSDVIVRATQEIGEGIDADFGKTVATVAESMGMLKNEIIILLGEIQKKTGIFTLMANGIRLVSENLEYVAAIMAAAFGAAVAGRIASIVVATVQLTKALRGAATAGAILQGVTGVGLVKVIGGLTASGGALYMMNQLFDESAENAEELVGAINNATGAADEQEKTAAELLALRQQQKEEEDALEDSLDEQARILARQLEDFNAISGALALASEDFSTQLDLQNALIGATDEQKQLINEIAGIEQDRTDALRELNDLTLVSAEERAQKEQEINAEYDDRIELINEQLEKEQQINALIEHRRALRSASDEYAVMAGSVQNLMDQLDKLDSDERNRIRMRFELGQQTAQDLVALQDKYADLRLQQELANEGELSQAQNDFLNLKYAEELVRLAEIASVRSQSLEQYLAQLDRLNEKSRSFDTGVREAFLRLKDQFEDSAQFGEKVVTTMADGFSNAILKFVETGKLSFKDLFKTLVAELVKLAANKIFLALFSPEGGIFGGLFAGLFDNGGNIPAGRIGIAGEYGPELVAGPAQVMSRRDTASLLGGQQTVIYNINAVDAPSFQALVASDPEFIYAVTQTGARRLPGSR